MGDIRIELRPSIVVCPISTAANLLSALIAEIGTQMIFRSTCPTVTSQLSTRHGNKRTVRSFDDLQVSHHKAVIECDTAKRLKPIIRVFHQLDTYFRNLHVVPSEY
jgi:hypothetical protein